MADELPLQHNPLVDARELERLHSQFFSWALTCTGGRRGEAEDVLQMSYLAVIEGRARFDGASSLRTWLFAVIRNSARSRWRMARYGSKRLLRLTSFMPPEAEAPVADSPHSGYERAETSDRVVAAWRALPSRQREVLDLVFYRDLSIADAALVLGVAVGTARLHYERGKATLRRQLSAAEIAG